MVLCASLFMLVACGENSDKTYSLNTTEDGISVSYSLQFLKGNSVKLVRTADGKTVTYEGTYSDLGKGKYSINIEDSSTLDPIDDFYFNLSITVDGEKFTFDKEKTRSQKSVKETGDDKKENENYVIENPEKVIDYSGNYDEKTEGTGDNHGESTGGVQPGEVKKPQGNNDQCIHKNLHFEPDKSPTCTEDGYKGKVHCLDCGYIIQDRVIKPKKGHPQESIVKEADLSPTCTEDGYIGKEYCSVCGMILQEKRTVPATGHPQESIVKEDDLAPTCTEDGHTGREYCAICGLTTAEETVISATGHHVENHICSNCNEVFEEGEYTAKTILHETNDQEGNTSYEDYVYTLKLEENNSFQILSTHTNLDVKIIGASYQDEYLVVTIVSSGEEILVIEENGYEQKSEYVYEKESFDGNARVFERIELDEPEYSYETNFSGTYTKKSVAETIERTGTYTFDPQKNAAVIGSRKYVLDFENNTFTEEDAPDEKVNIFHYKESIIKLYYGDYDGVTLETIAQSLITEEKETIETDHYRFDWYKNGLPTSTLVIPTSPISLEEDNEYTLEVLPESGYTLVTIEENDKKLLFFAEEGAVQACENESDYVDLLDLSANYSYSLVGENALRRTPIIATITYIGNENHIVEIQLGSAYTIEAPEDLNTWYTKDKTYTSGESITVNGDIELYPARYTVVYYTGVKFITVTDVVLGEISVGEMDGYTNEGFVVGETKITLDNLPKIGEVSVQCVYISKEVDTAPTEDADGSFIVKKYVGTNYAETAEEIPYLNANDYAVEITVEPTLLTNGEKRYSDSEYGTYTVTMNVLTEQTFQYDSKTYTIAISGDTATIDIDGEESSASVQRETDRIVFTVSGTGEAVETTLYKVSLQGDAFIIGSAESDLSQTDNVTIGKEYKVLIDTGLKFYNGEGYYILYNEQTSDNEIIFDSFDWVDTCYIATAGDDTYYVSFANGDMYFAENETNLPTSEFVDDLQAYEPNSVYRIGSDSLTFSADGFVYNKNGEETIGKYKADGSGKNIVLYNEIASSEETVYIYSVQDGNVSITKE